MNVIDLFCGAGGFSEGFRQAGFDLIFALDKNKMACKTFKHNFSETQVVQADILKYEGGYPDNIDVVIGSPPCKEFSKGNINRTWDTTLTKKFIEVVESINPKYYVMENVPDIQQVINPFSSEFINKFPTQKVLCAYDFGCATVRTRLFAGKFPKEIKKSQIKRNVKDVINPNMSGFQQPFSKKVYRRIDPNKPLFTICSQRIGNERYLLPNGRTLEVSELAIIQGFPPWFIFPCSRSEAQKLVGLSVCPPVAKAIADAINSNSRRSK